MATLLFANNIQTTLATSITSSQTSVTLTSTAGRRGASAVRQYQRADSRYLQHPWCQPT